MNRVIKVLLIDSNSSSIEVYKIALKNIKLKNENLKFEIYESNNYDLAIELLKNIAKGFDIVFLDVRLLFSNNSNILSGEYVGFEIRKKHKKTKIIVSTSYNNTSRILSLIKNINPDGFLIKNDLTTETLIDAINHVILTHLNYYSKSVLEILR